MSRSTTIMVVLLTLAVLPAARYAIADNDHDRARALSAAGTIVPLEKITSQLHTRRIDHILDVELESNDAGHFYEIEGLDDQGRVRKLQYDATTGQLMNERDDD